MYKMDITLQRTLRTAPKEVCVIERVDCIKVLLDDDDDNNNNNNNNKI